jgi:GNAT superfamily N-acetyltransferase
MHAPFEIRAARPEDFTALGELVASAYADLPGMPGRDAQPAYYAMLADVARRARNPAIRVLAAVDAAGALIGCADFISDMAHYGSGGIAGTIRDAAGIRLLAVAPSGRGRGVGRALTRACIDAARALGRSAVILHTTRAMQVAWAMYERIGFVRFADIDFHQAELEVFGFRLKITATAS